ncbi:sulfotransferase [Chthoniobacter flavus Ellin428]|uniref:Sulfotransferase n=1 Tax=Chthoniobacter flavus Ellin428 TaxID=497964 RepID=B4D6K5_9BACT|nr:tetratricopeptide repeat-containing sulfotransferase family protein [Chthoniobacter flavus]EDY17806.1 sulfotransferase [Chthoniobacter flavus Ellin428]TCO88418.1 Tfp pilus assembly protein PilF [Chthoniobacter flavus]
MTHPTPDPRQRLEAAFEDLRAGRTKEAQQAADGLRRTFPDHAGVRNLLALIALDQQAPQRAAQHLEHAIRLDPREPIYHCNLGEARRALQEMDKAIESFRQALALKPDYLTAALNLGSAYFATKNYAAALAAFDRAIEISPANALAPAYRADALRELGQLREAIHGYEEALEIDPDLPHAVGNLGLLLLGVGQPERAVELARRATELEPHSGTAWMNLGNVLRSLDRLEEAMDAFAQAQEKMPDSAELCTLIGGIWQETDDLIQAESWYEKALEAEPGRLETRCALASTVAAAGDSTAAVEEFRQIVAEHPESFEAQLGLGNALWEEGEAEGAVAAMRAAAALRPENAGALASLASIQASAGDVEEANASNRAALAINPRCIPALSNLALNLRGKLPEADAHTMEDLLAAKWPRQGARASVHFGLAHYWDGRKEYVRAGEHAVAANALHSEFKRERGWHYEPVEYEQHIGQLISAFSPEFFRRTQGMGRDSEAPVFIVGMPRSGTTLTEQILASHPHVFGAGERNFAGRVFHSLPALLDRTTESAECLTDVGAAEIRALADWHLEQLQTLVEKAGGSKSVERIVDKMPDNYSLLGWIVTAFPKARIIHCRRDVRDVAVSCWMTPFKEIRWAFDLRHIGQRILQYERIMEHWRKVLPVPMLEIDYEETVADQAGQTRRLLDFVGLPWDDACLEFHRTERLVRTASVTQVRQPIYKRSLERWRHYEPVLGPLLEILGTGR